MNNNYDDIINLPHHVSTKHNQMSLENRAAQFAPFAALSGFEGEISESARLTDGKLELDDDLKEVISLKLQIINAKIKEQLEFTFVYFIPDQKKQGGMYKTITKVVKKIDDIYHVVYFTDQTSIQIEAIVDIRSEVFSIFELF